MADVGSNPFEALSAVNALSQPADKYINDSSIELAWAIKAHEHAEVFFNLITSVDPSHLRLCRQDDDIYKKFRDHFPDFIIDKIAEEEMKSPAAKEKWRNFCTEFKGVIQDFNFGTMLRLDCNGIYDSVNSIFVTRIQFLAIEIARNREGFNKHVYNAACLKNKTTEENKDS
ncbi:protein PBDC1-like [Styela clava]|uniref:protein PBDC1-like n=1 Tax=Styela clava TaxID=7725 RepID=UPI00193ACCA9|nr:protein PBDC1-like [Styela clava]